ncbi:NAD(P)/FAD-dependent oxidoreductase [Entomobacter blattae]|uniref:FAD-dependent protein C-terminal domain-containing protein n=1 Tax=Entomobacter blattae TaxID=2762277 RepID=A0A7H1NQU0_9PROT|nr:FAD-dependent oxidoreductase [Entomobacter blattae]QNT78150.1 hypothetical protein JGUZn3_09180 [Entomobacter blattae]
MLRLTELKLPLDHSPQALTEAICKRLGIAPHALERYEVTRRGYDARKRGQISFVYTLECYLKDPALEAQLLEKAKGQKGVSLATPRLYHFVLKNGAQLASHPAFLRPVIIGAGPCGVMAGLILAQMGLRPLILERGKVVRERTADTFAFWRQSILNPQSNVQFGEGGAGTFSDGKLHSQISDPHHYGYKVLQEFVKAGAPEEILYLSKPHIGTFRLVSMVEHIRTEIEALGGEYRFNTQVTGLRLGKTAEGQHHIEAVCTQEGEEIAASHVILAIGHSARDTFAMLHQQGVVMHAKPFSIGVRIEHPQSLIDQARFGAYAGHSALGAADYKLAWHTDDERGVYSFCMCPGGSVVAATSEPGQVVTNGMSQYSRAERNANAGLVVGVTPGKDFPNQVLAGVDFQRKWEKLAYEVGGGQYFAPAQRVEDFLAHRASTHIGEVIPSYKPGVTPADLRACLPAFVSNALQDGIAVFERKLPGFSKKDAMMTGVETRTSSPVRIPRNEKGQSLGVKGLYPAGEGAGYAGGILSAAVDGIRVAEWLAQDMSDQA